MPVHDVVHTCQVGKKYLFVRTRCGETADLPGKPERPTVLGEGEACSLCADSLACIKDDAQKRLAGLVSMATKEAS